jgi:hypothetical protein
VIPGESDGTAPITVGAESGVVARAPGGSPR